MTDLTHDVDDGFHEIQLSGKQLVFLFMATTVVSVVIFLCGVLVGRGVRAEPLTPGDSAGPSSARAAAPQSAPGPAAEAPPAAEGGSLSYPGRLGSEKPVAEDLKQPRETPKPAEPPPAETPGPAAAPVPAPAAAPATAAAAESKPGPRAGTWAVQVVALTDRAAANAVVTRLVGKGYPAFLVTPQPGGPVQNYKVQVGRYGDRSEAELIRTRLKKEEQFEPWILR